MDTEDYSNTLEQLKLKLGLVELNAI